MQTEIDHIVSLLTRTFEKDAWHGPSVREVLSSINSQQALQRFPNTHSIIELVAHMSAWRIYVVQKLQGNAVYAVSPEMNFPSPSDWQQTVEELFASQRTLLDTVKTFPPSRLQEQVAGNEQPLTYYTLLHGIIHHDLYHAGQIKLIHKGTVSQPL